MDRPDSHSSKPKPARPAPGSDDRTEPAKKPTRVRPTPVRESLDAGGGRPTLGETPERTFVVDGVQWTARAIGRATGARGSGRLPLLELAFHRQGTDERRTALWVADSLGDLSEGALAEALAGSRPRPEG